MESIDQPMLVIDGGDNDGKTIPIGKTTVRMGRLPDNDVVVNETGGSRNHAEIVGTDSGYYLRDLNSTNGTGVNRTRIGESEHLLHDGDRIRLASCDVSFVFRYFAASTLEMTMIKSPIEEGAEGSREADQDQGAPGEGAQASSASELEVPVESFEATVEPVDEEIYEGTVKLKVEAEGDIQQVVQFVQELRQNENVISGDGTGSAGTSTASIPVVRAEKEESSEGLRHLRPYSFAQMILDAGVLSAEQISKAQEAAQREREPLGHILVRDGLVLSRDLATLTALHLGLPMVDLRSETVELDAVRLLPQDIARRYLVLPVRQTGDRMTVAMTDPTDLQTIQDITPRTGLTIEPVIAPPEEHPACGGRANFADPGSPGPSDGHPRGTVGDPTSNQVSHRRNPA